MDWWVAGFVLGLALLYVATRNVLSYVLVYYWHLLPAILALPSEVGVVVATGAVAKGIGALMCNAVLRFNPGISVARFRKAPVTSLFGSGTLGRYTMVCLVALTIALATYYFVTVGVALFAEDVGGARLAFKDAQGGWFYMRFIRTFMPILVLIYFMHWRVEMTRGRTVILVSLFLVNAVMLLLVGFKGHILMFIAVPVAILSGLAFEKVPVRALGLLGGAAVIGAFVATAALANESNLGAIFVLLWNRLVYQAYDGLTYIVMDIVPNRGFIGGETYIADIESMFYKLGLSSNPVQNLSAAVADELSGGLYQGLHASNTMEGEFYANFGFPGVIAGGILVGILLQLLYVAPIRIRKDAVILPFFVCLQLGILMSLGGPLVAMVIDYVVAISFFFLLLVGTYVFLSLPSGRIRLWRRI